MKEQLTAVFQQVPEGTLHSLKTYPVRIPRARHWRKRGPISKKPFSLVLESNRTIAEETLRNKTVVREPLASIS